MTAAPSGDVDGGGGARPGYRDTLRRLAGAQKSAKGGPAYSVYVNRRVGRLAAAGAYVAGLAPNTVTAVSAAFSVVGIAVIALVSSWPAAVAAPLLLAIGYALDAADGQLARLRGGGSVAGEWLDHMFDAGKIPALHLAVLVHLYRFADLDAAWLLVPVGFTIVAVVLFFAQLLNEQLARNRAPSSQPGTAPVEPIDPVRALVKLPQDYGLLCWVFTLLVWPRAFLAAYTFLFVASAGYLALAVVTWFGRMRALDAQPR